MEPSHVERQPEVAPGMGKRALKRKRLQEAASRAPPLRQEQQAGPRGGKGKGKEGHPRKARTGSYLTTRDGMQICFAWNRERDSCKTGACPDRRAHVCEQCLQPHRGLDCNNGGGGKGQPHM